jgi:hypothetical protein
MGLLAPYPAAGALPLHPTGDIVPRPRRASSALNQGGQNWHALTYICNIARAARESLVLHKGGQGFRGFFLYGNIHTCCGID